jgi:hypothetical protein
MFAVNLILGTASLAASGLVLQQYPHISHHAAAVVHYSTIAPNVQ